MSSIELLKSKNIFIHNPSFKYDLLPILNLTSSTSKDGDRWYTTSYGNSYPSVTTVLGSIDNEWLGKWRSNVGEKEAGLISSRATRRGKTIHGLFEEYLKTSKLDVNNFMPDVRQMVIKTLPLLDAHINTIRVQESPLYSTVLRLAGCPDLIAEWDGKLSVIDFKNSNRKKTHDQIKKYFAQCAGYSIMFEARYDLLIEQVVVLIAVEGEESQIFIENPLKYVPYLIEARDKYEKTHKEQFKTKEAKVAVG